MKFSVTTSAQRTRRLITRLASGVGEVDADVELVGVVVGEVTASVDAGHSLRVGSCRSQHLHTPLRLHPDHSCPVIGEISSSQRPDAYPAEVENLQSFERAGLGISPNGRTLPSRMFLTQELSVVFPEVWGPTS